MEVGEALREMAVAWVVMELEAVERCEAAARKKLAASSGAV